MFSGGAFGREREKYYSGPSRGKIGLSARDGGGREREREREVDY
jgi:hypothetical protein